MFSCNYCSLTFTTEQELNVHIEKCDKNTQPPLSEPCHLDSYICEACCANLVTAEEFAMHEKTCEIKKLTATLIPQVEELIRTINISDKASKRCRICKMNFTTRKDLIVHRYTCKKRKVRKLLKGLTTNLEEWCKKFESVKCQVTVARLAMYRNLMKKM
ncbi:uncharacterized protein LOC109863514 isoform X2 [Pseudomyrmex gracilis]|uniref:uncharacterized protein LOC109863514 isoform X2 n=1 Tax=Pseudomyrmex gracilis TaxID=219809 RepID=UPI000995204E|nr:uncharacterized protein LOC109863514 isoform X2 [Pseudomyrmex gracilis]